MGDREAKRGAAHGKVPIETELRLAGTPEALEAVFASETLRSDTGDEDVVQDLENRYFDTLDQSLRARGLAFRVRANGKGYRQTLKANDDAMAALSKRSEWDMPLEDGEPKPEALPGAARELMPKAALEGDLKQAFRTRVHRQTRRLTFPAGQEPASLIEAAFDRGAIETDGASVAIAEIELELIEGEGGRLYDLALALQEIAPLRLETRSKSTRAFDHLAGRPPSWRRAAKLALHRKHSVDDAMARIFGNCFEQWLANQAAAFDGRDPEGVHQMRVAVRRLRSAFSTFKTLIPDDQLAWLQASARETLCALGPARDWDVFQGDLLAPVMAARPDDPGLVALRRRVESRRRAGYRRVRKHLESPAYTRFALRFGQWLERRGWRDHDDRERSRRQAESIRAFAVRQLKGRYKRACRKGRHFDDLPTEQRHELRISMKKLRYAIEFLAPLFERKAVKPFVQSVKSMQEDLGHLNDVAVAETLLNGLLARPGKQDISAAAGLVIGWHARGVAMAEPALRRDWRAFKRARTFWT